MPREQAAKSANQQYADLYARIDVDAIMHGLRALDPEVAFAIDFEKRLCREIGRKIGRDYGQIGEWEIPGSCDLIGIRGDRVVIRDYKFGKHDGPNSLQNKFFCASLYLLGRGDSFLSEVVEIDPDTGSHRVLTSDIGLFDIEDYISQVRAGMVRAKFEETEWRQTGTVHVKVGDWCQWCNSRPACPAYTSLARSMVTDLVDIRSRLEAMTPLQQGEAWVKMKAAKQVLEDVESGLKAIAAENRIPVGEDKEVRSNWQSKSSLSATELEKLAVNLGANAEDIERCRRTTTFQVFRVLPVKKGQ
jgi:hypothetical protein